MKSSLFELILAALFPPRCAACETTIARGAACAACVREIEIARTFFCGECRRPVPAGRDAFFSACHPSFPFVLGAAGRYEAYPMKALIHALKFKGFRAAAEPLGAMLASYIARANVSLHDFTIVPIPLSRQRERIRGFNQSELIARAFAGHLALPVEPSLLARTRNTMPQSETKSSAERRENIRGCFAVPHGASVRGKRILLVDDVVTSGATALEAVRTLRAAGAERVLVLAPAQA